MIVPPELPTFGTATSPPTAEPISPEEATAAARLFKALADPARLRLLARIAANPGQTCVCDLLDCCALTQPTISHHLKVLRQAGLVDSERRGTWVYYRIQRAALDRARDLLNIID